MSTIQKLLTPEMQEDVDFINMLYTWFTGEIKVNDTLLALRQLDVGVQAQLLPWLWGAWYITPSPKAFMQARMIIKDWWAGVSTTQPVNTLPPTLLDVYKKAHNWHGMFESDKTGKPLPKWAVDAIPTTFNQIAKFPDSISLWAVRKPLQRNSAQVLMEVGHVLAHCYLHLSVAQDYCCEHEMCVLFDAEWMPRCCIAIKRRLDDTGKQSWQITEMRGIYNIFPVYTYWPYLASIMGIRRSAFLQMPPGIDYLPANAGTGEPPRALDPRPDGADPVILETWAAGHLRQPLISSIQQRFTRIAKARIVAL